MDWRHCGLGLGKRIAGIAAKGGEYCKGVAETNMGGRVCSVDCKNELPSLQEGIGAFWEDIVGRMQALPV
jgi:hypothetical protein